MSSSRKTENFLLEYLAETYTATHVIESGPFLVIQCDVVPSLDERPFLVADCVAILLNPNDPLPRDLGFYGELSMGQLVTLPDDIAPLHWTFSIPCDKTLDATHSLLYLDALFISYITSCVIIELPKTDIETFITWLKILPSGFSNSSASINYVNGPLNLSSHEGIIKPNSRLIIGQSDNTDYIKASGCFSPGATVSSKKGSQITSGIAIAKDNDFHVTVAYRAWKAEPSEVTENVETMKQHEESTTEGGAAKSKATEQPPQIEAMPVFQGAHEAGDLLSRVCLTDIGLVKIDTGITFSNTFLDIESRPHRLLLLDEIKYRERFLMESFVTGVQVLLCLGVRRASKEGLAIQDFTAHESLPPFSLRSIYSRVGIN